MAGAAANGARGCACRSVVDRQTIVFRELVRGAPLVDTGFGTAGPGPDAAGARSATDAGAAGGLRRAGQPHRLRRGPLRPRDRAGCGDKGMAPRLIGIAFDCRRWTRCPSKPHDVPLEAVLTESGLRSFRQPDRKWHATSFSRRHGRQDRPHGGVGAAARPDLRLQARFRHRQRRERRRRLRHHRGDLPARRSTPAPTW